MMRDANARLDDALARLAEPQASGVQERLALLERELAETRLQRDTAGRQLQEVLSSSSWNFTKPLRRLKIFAGRLLGRWQ